MVARLTAGRLQATFCENKLKTAFAVFNGVSFAFSLGTLFLTAVLPVYLKKSDWDLQVSFCCSWQ